jgi:GT2 family glycosyltransferase
MTPALSIVIVNSDGLDDTLKCLDSIYQNPPRVPFEIILVDNCSKVDSVPVAIGRYPELRGYVAPRRQGFARNYNLGISESNGELVVVLNNDTIVTPGALDKLVVAMRDNPSYGMVGPRLCSLDGSTQLDCARRLPTPLAYTLGTLLLDPGMLVGRLWVRLARAKTARRRSGPVPCISGACMMISRDLLEVLGPLDEGYDFYYEDVEWCHRTQVHGFQVAYIAEAAITHFGDQSLSKVKVWAKQSEYRSALRYFRQYHRLSDRQAWMVWFATALSFFFRGFLFLLNEMLDGRAGYARAYFYLWSWVLRRHPASPEIAELLETTHSVQALGGVQ